jgi:PEGA domain
MRKNKKIMMVLSMILFLIVSNTAIAQGKGRLKIESKPSTPPAKVWIDGKLMGETPLELPYLKAGIHVVRSTKSGIAVEKRVLLKKGTEVELVAEFSSMPNLVVKNQDALSYKPVQEISQVTFGPRGHDLSPADSDPLAPPASISEPPKTNEPEPEPEQPVVEEPVIEPEPEPAEPITSDSVSGSSVEDAGTVKPLSEPVVYPEGWSPDPQEGKMGPPIPPDIMKLLQDRISILEANTVVHTTPDDPVTEPVAPGQPEPEPEVITPCSTLPGAEACGNHTGIRGAILSYYCYLSKNDFAHAYEMRIIARELEWFAGVCKPFCSVYGFKLRGFAIESSTTKTASTTYIVDLLDKNNALIESWQMNATMTKQDDKWLIMSATGKKVAY